MEIQKIKLPKFLANQTKKLLSLCFRKLVMFEESSDEEDVKHYDLECQGIMIIEGVLKNKIQCIMMKSLEAIKNISKIYDSTHRRYRDHKNRQIYQNSMYSRQNTLKPYSNHRNYMINQSYYEQDPSFITHSTYNPQTPVRQIMQQSNYYGYQVHNNSFNKVKFLNSNSVHSQSQYRGQQNLQGENNNDIIASRELKRRIIIEKLNNLERDIHQISTIDYQIYSQKSSIINPYARQMKNSNILNYQFGQQCSARKYYDIY